MYVVGMVFNLTRRCFGLYNNEKQEFLKNLKGFADVLNNHISTDNQWNVRGFIDVFKRIYTISSDTKVVSKILELHLFPYFLSFAKSIDYRIELAKHQNWYPDLTFVSNENPSVKFAVDLKTTYRDEQHPGFCNGFTLGSHGEYFVNRRSSKNIQYPYSDYSGHFCLGIIYSRTQAERINETKVYSVEEISSIPAVIHNFLFFAEEKWKIASDKGGSGNTANIGSIQKIEDILSGNGVFAKAGEEFFDEYWANYGKMEIKDPNGNFKKLSSFSEFLTYKGLPETMNNPKSPKRKGK